MYRPGTNFEEAYLQDYFDLAKTVLNYFKWELMLSDQHDAGHQLGPMSERLCGPLPRVTLHTLTLRTGGQRFINHLFRQAQHVGVPARRRPVLAKQRGDPLMLDPNPRIRQQSQRSIVNQLRIGLVHPVTLTAVTEFAIPIPCIAEPRAFCFASW